MQNTEERPYDVAMQFFTTQKRPKRTLIEMVMMQC